MLQQEAAKILKKYFVFDRMFNLLDYDSNMQLLYDELKLLKREIYQSNYRFIFFHYDTEYYITNDSPGITLLNLQKILASLDIPNFFCLIITQQDVRHWCQQLKTQLTTDDCSIGVIPNMLHAPIHPDKFIELEVNEQAITKKYITLNRVGRFHRRVLISWLKHKNLLEHGKVSFNGR